jgi:hypothetical protein
VGSKLHRRLPAIVVAGLSFCLFACQPAEELEEHHCSSLWGIDDAAEGAVFVVPRGDASGDGTLTSPYGSVERALEATRAGEGQRIALTEGTFRASPEARRLALSGDEGDSGLTIVGCGIGATILEAIEALPANAPAGAEEELQPAVELFGQLDGVTISNLTVLGGRRGIIARDGVGENDPLRLEGIRIEDCQRSGLVIEGLTSQAQLVNLEVVDIFDDESGDLGYGVALQGQGSVWNDPEGEVEILDSSIVGATRVGLYVDHVRVDVFGLEVRDTAPVDDQMGRGIQVQSHSTGTFDGLTVTGNSDAGMFLHMPLDVVVRNSVFSGTARTTIPGLDEAGPAGDGLSAVPASVGGGPGDWSVTLSNNTFENNGRAGALLEGVTVYEAGGNTFTGNELVGDGETYPAAPDVDTLYVQGGAAVLEGDALELGGASDFDALEFFREPLEADDLSD